MTKIIKVIETINFNEAFKCLELMKNNYIQAIEKVDYKLYIAEASDYIERDFNFPYCFYIWNDNKWTSGFTDKREEFDITKEYDDNVEIISFREMKLERILK